MDNARCIYLVIKYNEQWNIHCHTNEKKNWHKEEEEDDDEGKKKSFGKSNNKSVKPILKRQYLILIFLTNTHLAKQISWNHPNYYSSFLSSSVNLHSFIYLLNAHFIYLLNYSNYSQCQLHDIFSKDFLNLQLKTTCPSRGNPNTFPQHNKLAFPGSGNITIHAKKNYTKK